MAADEFNRNRSGVDHIITDPDAPDMILQIMTIPYDCDPAVTETQARAVKEKIQDILDANDFAGVCVSVIIVGKFWGVKILAETPLPKSFGINDWFEGVPVGFDVMPDLREFMERQRKPDYKGRIPKFMTPKP